MDLSEIILMIGNAGLFYIVIMYMIAANAMRIVMYGHNRGISKGAIMAWIAIIVTAIGWLLFAFGK